MAFFISRGVQKSLQIGGMILGLAAILGLIHHGRFAAYKYDVIDQDGILPSLLKTVVKGDKDYNLKDNLWWRLIIYFGSDFSVLQRLTVWLNVSAVI